MGGSSQSKQRSSDTAATRTGPKGYENVKRVKRVENAGGISLITERPIRDDDGDTFNYQSTNGRPASAVIESPSTAYFGVTQTAAPVELVGLK